MKWVVKVAIFLVLAMTGLSLAALLWWLLSRRREEAEGPTEEKPAMELVLDEEPGEDEAEAPAPSPEAKPTAVPAPLAERSADAAVDVMGSPPTPSELQAGISPAADDLTVLEGIGPKIAGVLSRAGILTFSQLAASEVPRLRQILEGADPRLLRLSDPATWPEQAGLAAAGQWHALKALQATLIGGRRR